MRHTNELKEGAKMPPDDPSICPSDSINFRSEKATRAAARSVARIMRRISPELFEPKKKK